MTQPTSHQTVITRALDQWWLNSDPAKPLDHTAAARQVEEHLLHAGFYITPFEMKKDMPKRRDIATVLVLALVCATAAVLATLISDWLWGALGTLGTVLLVHQAAGDIRDRRRINRR